MQKSPRTQEADLMPLAAQARMTAFRDPSEDWQVLGETFEALGKAGLAMTVGFSVAAVFCKLVDSGKLKLPNMLTLLANHATEEPAPKPR